MELISDNAQDPMTQAPTNWTLERLGQMGIWLSGGTPSMSDESYWSGDIPWVSPKDMKSRRLFDSIDHVSEKALGNGARIAPRHALLMVVRGMILVHSFPVARAERDLAFNQDIKALVVREGIDSNFVLHLLSAYAGRMVGLANESTHGTKRIPSEALFAVEFCVPPIAEQRAIAAALEDMDALLRALDKLIAKKRDLKRAAMQQLLTGEKRLPDFGGGWEVRRLGELFQFLRTANNSRADLFTYGEVGYIHYGDIHESTTSFLDCAVQELPYIPQEKIKNIPLLKDGDLVMADASEDYEGVGKSVEVKNVANRKIVAGLHTFLLRGNRELLADGFKGYLQHVPVVKKALVELATGISVYGISKANVKSIEVPLPTREEQTAIATVLSDMDTEIAALEARLAKTRLLKQGMMQELLTGHTRLV